MRPEVMVPNRVRKSIPSFISCSVFRNSKFVHSSFRRILSFRSANSAISSLTFKMPPCNATIVSNRNRNKDIVCNGWLSSTECIPNVDGANDDTNTNESIFLPIGVLIGCYGDSDHVHGLSTTLHSIQRKEVRICELQDSY